MSKRIQYILLLTTLFLVAGTLSLFAQNACLNYITWDVSPFIYEGEYFGIGWYGVLAFLLSICFLLNLVYIFKHEKQSTRNALITFIIALPLIELCGHIVHCVFYEWYYFEDSINIFCWNFHWRNPSLEHPWKLLDLAHGGFASHGAYLGALVSVIILRKVIPFESMWLFDRLTICSCLMFFTRMGNFITSEIYGVATTLPWGVVFEGEQQPCHPTQLYEIGIFLSAYFLGYYLYLKKDAGYYKGLLTGVLFVYIFSLRFCVELIKQPQGLFEANWVLDMGQWLSIPFVIIGVYLIIHAKKLGMIYSTSKQAKKHAR